jgi:hypothetical protein
VEELLQYCYRGDVHAIRHLIATFGPEAVVGANNKSRMTGLHCAATNGCVEVVALLIKSGANVNAKDNDGSTGLHCAATNGRVEVVARLISSYIEAAKEEGSRTKLEDEDINVLKEKIGAKELALACKSQTQGRMGWGIHGLSKSSLGSLMPYSSMPYSSMPCGWSPLNRHYGRVSGGHPQG